MLPFRLLFHPCFSVDLGPHVFPAQKYRLVREALLAEGVAEESDFVAPPPAADDDVLRVHTPGYVKKIQEGTLSPVEIRTLEIPWSRGLVEGTWRAAGAAMEAGRRALKDRCAIVIGGGFHHAFPDHGEGFCLIHDVAIAVRALRAEGSASRLAVLDLDVHHGNGTAAILGQDPLTLTVSLHQEGNYPALKPRSSLDVSLPDGTGDEAYLAALETALRCCEEFRPDLVFYLAGADPYEHDLLGGLGLTQAGLRQRDARVFEALRGAGAGVAVTLAGGYAESPSDTVAIHVNTVRAAAEVYGAH